MVNFLGGLWQVQRSDSPTKLNLQALFSSAVKSASTAVKCSECNKDKPEQHFSERQLNSEKPLCAKCANARKGAKIKEQFKNKVYKCNGTCNSFLPKGEFSKTQWNTGAEKRKCIKCGEARLKQRTKEVAETGTKIEDFFPGRSVSDAYRFI